MRTQPQFPDPNREEIERMKDFSRFCIGLFVWVLIFLGSLLAIGYCSANGEKIDNHYNHVFNERNTHY